MTTPPDSEVPADARYPQHTGVRPPDAPTGEPDDEAVAPAGRSFLGHVGAAVRELVIVGAIALLLSFLVKTFLVQAFYIPSESMESTLVKNDRVIVSKLTPDVIGLKRGDVVVFADPDHWLAPEPSVNRGPILNAVTTGLTFVGLLPDKAEGHLIKRVIGLPGDHVVCCDAAGRLSINDSVIAEPYVKAGEKPSQITFDITVPADRIWVMGDNRGHSSDSRLHDDTGDGSTGSVPVNLVVGRAVALVWPVQRWDWLSNYSATYTHVPAP